MLRAVFIGSHSCINELLTHWLSQRTQLAGVVWTSRWQRSLADEVAFALRRLRKKGALRLLDEALLFLYLRLLQWPAEDRAMIATLVEPYRARHGAIDWRGPAVHTDDPNRPEVLDFIRAARPDVALAQCVNYYFGAQLRAVPRHGVLIWHEGITPEYRGVWAPFWTCYNLDFDQLGCTLLRASERLDAGEIFVQHTVGVDARDRRFGLAGHRAIVESLPAVEKFLVELERGTARPLARPGKGRLYGYPGMSDYLRQCWRARSLFGDWWSAQR